MLGGKKLCFFFSVSVAFICFQLFTEMTVDVGKWDQNRVLDTLELTLARKNSKEQQQKKFHLYYIK